MRRYGLLGLVALVACVAPPAAAQARTYRFRMPAIAVSPYQVRLDTTRAKTPRINGYITRMRAYLVDRHGRPLSVKRLMLHHVLFTELGRRTGDRHDGTCPDIPRERFYGTGEEHQVMHLPKGYGIPIHKHDRWQAAWMVMSHQSRDDRAYIKYEVTVTRRKLTPVKAFWLDVTGCHGPVQYDVPGGGEPGTTDTKPWTWTIPANGRLVAGGAHLHGGAQGVRLRQPACGDRELVTSRPLYGLPGNVVYHVTPVLHEPGPIASSWFMSRRGIPVSKGEKIRVEGLYDAQYPHAAVMSIDHVYMARGPAPETPCAPLPGDLTNGLPNWPGRPLAPQVTIPLTGIGANGKTKTIDGPPGPMKIFNAGFTVDVRNSTYSQRVFSIPLGAEVKWRFLDHIKHSITFANGPEAFSSTYLQGDRTYAHTFTRPGTYRLFCVLHPISMHQLVEVRPGATPPKVSAKSSEPANAPVIHW
jgi:plastocyanin